jgi:hypothetical protein
LAILDLPRLALPRHRTLDSPRELGYFTPALIRHLLKNLVLELPWLAGAAGGPQGEKLI